MVVRGVMVLMVVLLGWLMMLVVLVKDAADLLSSCRSIVGDVPFGAQCASELRSRLGDDDLDFAAVRPMMMMIVTVSVMVMMVVILLVMVLVLLFAEEAARIAVVRIVVVVVVVDRVG